jgi:4'-phosphopantetheinyl transferase
VEVDSKLPSSNIWRLPPTEPQLSDGSIHVYRISLDLPDGDIQEMARILSPDENARANRFVFPSFRAHFIAGRAQLRLILCHYLQKKPADLVFDYNEFGKPFINQTGDIQFNISHSHELGLVAITKHKPVGVDIERIRTDIDYTQIARQFFASGEVEQLLALPEEQRIEAFYTCWTRKEAFIKARGMGLSIPLDQFEVSFTANSPPRLTHSMTDLIHARDWSLYELRPGTGYIAALAAQSQDWDILCWQWPLRRLSFF